MPPDTVLYDGWPAVFEPLGPAAIHLAALLACHPAELPAALALPAPPGSPLPGWLPDHIAPHFQPSAATPFARLAWEQRTLPALARRLGAGLLHLTTPTPPLFASTPVLVSPAGYSFSWSGGPQSPRAPGERAGLAAHLRDAFAAGGMSRARLCWPEDLPPPSSSPSPLRLPPVVPPAFLPGAGASPAGNGAHPPGEASLDLPEAYILYHGPHAPGDLRRLLDAWRWAAAPVGGDTSLLLPGMSPAGQQHLENLKAEYGVGETVRALPVLSLDALARLYRGCTALLHPAPVSPWGGPLRLALACGLPVVGLESPLSDALMGSAAYLVKAGRPEETGRALGAALITVVVEEEVSSSLAQAARQRSSGWDLPAFSARLLSVYRSILER